MQLLFMEDRSLY